MLFKDYVLLPQWHMISTRFAITFVNILLQLAACSSIMDSVDLGGYDSDLEEPPPKKPLVEKTMDSNMERGYKNNPDQLGGFTSYHDKEAWKVQAFHLRKMDAYTRHKELIRNYVKFYGGKVEDFERNASKDRNDYTVLQQNHKFLWDSNETEKPKTWEEQLAKRYYDKLFKEYCIADLSKYESKKIALRWRIEKEVKSGKGQFICGNKACPDNELLSSWEVNFAYLEGGEKKNALVKIRLCPDCAIKLNIVKKVSRVKKKKSKKRKRRSRRSSGESRDETASNAEASSSKDTEAEVAVFDGSDNVWAGPAPETLVKTNEEEMDDFLDDMFL